MTNELLTNNPPGTLMAHLTAMLMNPLSRTEMDIVEMYRCAEVIIAENASLQKSIENAELKARILAERLECQEREIARLTTIARGTARAAARLVERAREVASRLGRQLAKKDGKVSCE
jgi:Holliday junction resolvasome RuvABC ATP-dependent DNA helicase subunit